MRALGRKPPVSWNHVEKWPFRAAPLSSLMPAVEKVLKLPDFVYQGQWDQGQQGACEGFGHSMMMTLLNTAQTRSLHRYDPIWLWNEAKKIDEWPDTNPGDDNGTSNKAACDVLRTEGHVRVVRSRDLSPNISEGIKENRWATSVDDMRAVLGLGIPIAIGVNWYANFDQPSERHQGLSLEYWIGGGELGPVRGGHCVCVYGASDKRQAFKFVNSWGKSYPPCWLPYQVMERLIREDGEVSLVTDL